MKTLIGKRMVLVFAAMMLLGAVAFAKPVKVYAADAEAAVTAEEAGDSATGAKAIGAAIVVGLAALGGALAMGNAISKSNEGISRQPEAAGNIRTILMLGLVFIETVVIYALIIGILIVFVL